jgi:uncharacterized membrane protein YcaP (DUF421 family)
MENDLVKAWVAIDWPGVLVPALSVAEKILRTVAVYLFLVIALRLAGKRELAQLNPFDFIVLLVLSNTLQNAVIGADNSVAGGFLGAATLLVLNFGVNRWLSRHPRIESFLVGRKRLLIVGGRVLAPSLKKENLTRQELELAAHKAGIPTLSEVQLAEIDPDGELFFVARTPPPEELRHRELVDKLEALGREVAELRARLDAKPSRKPS